jgi:hypothetical protein
MAQLTIEVANAVTIDGQTTTQNATFVVDVRGIAQGTMDLTSTYRQISDKTFSFVRIENVGGEPVILSTGTANSKFLQAGIAPGAHVLIPGRHGSASDGLAIGQSLSARTVSGTGRIVVTIGFNDSNG